MWCHAGFGGVSWLDRAKWLVPLERCIALPLAERRKRFLVPLWVLILVFPLALVIAILLLYPCVQVNLNRGEYRSPSDLGSADSKHATGFSENLVHFVGRRRDRVLPTVVAELFSELGTAVGKDDVP